MFFFFFETRGVFLAGRGGTSKILPQTAKCLNTLLSPTLCGIGFFVVGMNGYVSRLEKQSGFLLNLRFEL